MADITMCNDEQCKQKNKCYRYTAPRNKYWQAVFSVSPRIDETCEYFWDNADRKEKVTTHY